MCVVKTKVREHEQRNATPITVTRALSVVELTWYPGLLPILHDTVFPTYCVLSYSHTWYCLRLL